MIAEHVDFGTGVLVLMVLFGCAVLIVQAIYGDWEEKP